MKVLTKTALGGLINRVPEGIELHLEDKHLQYLDSQYIGDGDIWDAEFTHYKQGEPDVVTEWLSSFGIKKSFEPDSEYVIASVLDLIMTFQSEAEEKFFAIDEKTYKRSKHSNAFETKTEGLYCIPLEGEKHSLGNLNLHMPSENLRLYVSSTEQQPCLFDSAIQITHKMDLHVPDVESEFEEDIDAFNGMKVTCHGETKDVGSSGVITKFAMNNKGAEAKQAAYMSMVTSGCLGINLAPIRHRRIEVIDSNFYVYVTYKDKLAFGVMLDKEDFVQGCGEIEEVVSREPFYEHRNQAFAR